MINKIIHYVWLSKEPKPALISKCLKSWEKVLVPNGWTIKCWDMDNIPHNSWVDEAIEVKKWASASDYIRLYALYTDGGVYLDSDVFIKRDFSHLLDTDFFIPIEYNPAKYEQSNSAILLDADGRRKGVFQGKQDLIQGLTAQAAIVGGGAGNPIFKEMMEYYETHHFVNVDGTLNYDYLAPDLMAVKLEKYGFRYANQTYDLHDAEGRIVGKVYDTSYFASGIKDANANCYGIHAYSSTWKDYSTVESLIHRAKLFAKTILLLR